MGDYDFYAAQLRFAAAKAGEADPGVAGMMAALSRAADQIRHGREMRVPAEDLRLTARALAGVAGFLQRHILPEVVAAGNALGERQVRWTIDTSMACVARLMTHAELTGDGEALSMTLPDPPV
ncbi:MAG: hypothetical protein HQL35_03140 [Alphaproteobacteria bacterium]|nr:hypothetical protein [Alphaproteobacteria bacterium]